MRHVSESIITSSRGNTKATCGACHSTIYMVEINGMRVATDSELISVVPVNAGRREHARQIHAETCIRHQREYTRRTLAAERKRHR